MTVRGALAFVRRHGVVLEAAKGPVPNLAEAASGGRIHGSWWGHPKGKLIFWLTRAVRDSKDILVCRLVGGKVTYVHRRLWPALVRVARSFARKDLAAFREVHTKKGQHAIVMVPFPRWVPRAVKRRARRLTAGAAREALGIWLAPTGRLLSILVVAFALVPFALSGQALPAEPVVWHWFGACGSADSLMLSVNVDGKAVYDSTFAICHLRRTEVKPEPQERLLTFSFDAAPRRFGPQYHATEPERIVGTVWEAGRKGNAIVLGVSFATAERVLLNTRHVARADRAGRSEWIRGLVVTTRPVRHARASPN